MTDPDLTPRRYGEKEIGRILKRATEIQHREPSAPAASGMTLAELEEIAAEAGIDPQYLRRAAREVDTGSVGAEFWPRVVGDELLLVREAVVAGELPESGFERVVAVIQRVSREHGQPSLLGRTLTWQAETANKTRSLMVVVSVREGETQIRVEERLHQLAGGLFGGVLGGVGGGVGIGVGVPVGIDVLGSALFATAFPFGVLGLTFIAVRHIYRALAGWRRRVLAQLVEELVAEVSACVSEVSLEAGAPTPELGPG